ncbi:ATP-binding protein [Azoarcus taiwanensis]|uniref:histidine kinase n=2 Tax=Azoarcus taiwanensis TaxID=666964 RepID=A0A972F825_9RHOO|nr:ATP-binding protein [Azoarcus taiwanensis]
MKAVAGRMKRWRNSLRLRLLAGTLVWIVVAVLAAGWGLSSLFNKHVSRQFDAELGTHLDQLAANLVFDEAQTLRLRAPLSDPRLARPLSGLYWQVDRMGAAGEPETVALLRSRSLWDAVLAVPPDALADGEMHVHHVRGPNDEPLRMIEQVLRPAEYPDQALRLIVAATEDLISEPVARFNDLLGFALGALSLGLIGAVVVQVRTAWMPLERLREGLAQVHDGRNAAIEGRFPSEIQPLVDEFNGVLARNAEIVVRARTQAGNLAHAIKTPLAVLANAANRDDSALARVVVEQVALAQLQVDHHLARARAAAAVQIPGQRTAIRPVMEALVRVMERVHVERGVQITVGDFPETTAFRGETQDLQEMLGNLLDNAYKWASSRVDVKVAARNGDLVVTVEDDGRGLDASVREIVLERGVRTDEQRPGSGLGLAIVRDLALLYGGDIALDASPRGGLRASLRLPRA